MSKTYAVNGPSASGTANKTAVNIIGSTAIRPMVVEFAVGVTTAPNSTDQQVEFAIGRTTATGTAASNPTPLALDNGDAAAVSTAGITHSAEPTYASTFFMDQGMNQRGMFRWVAQPGRELIGAATASNGVGLKLVAVTAALVITGTIHFTE